MMKRIAAVRTVASAMTRVSRGKLRKLAARRAAKKASAAARARKAKGALSLFA